MLVLPTFALGAIIGALIRTPIAGARLGALTIGLPLGPAPVLLRRSRQWQCKKESNNPDVSHSSSVVRLASLNDNTIVP